MIFNDQYSELCLDNGLLVALQNTPTGTIAGRFVINHGALNERSGEEGIAHFLEHVIMAGGSGKYSSEQANELRGVFGSFNAHTNLIKTVFSVKMLPEDIQLYLDYVSDLAFNPRFEERPVEEERQRVLREIGDDRSVPYLLDYKQFYEAIYGEGSPHYYSILGKEEVINATTIEKLRGFHARGYVPNNAYLVLVGALPNNIEELVRNYFNSFKSGIVDNFKFPKNYPLEKATELHTFAADLRNLNNLVQSSASLSIGLFAPNEDHEDSAAVSLLVDALGGNGSSNLFANVSQRKGLAYSIKANYYGNNNKGIISISSNVSAIRAQEAIDAVFEEMAYLRSNLISDERLKMLKREYTFSFVSASESNLGRLNMIQTKLDKNLTPNQSLAMINAVTSEKIKEVAEKYLPESRADGRYVLLLRNPLKC